MFGDGMGWKLRCKILTGFMEVGIFTYING